MADPAAAARQARVWDLVCRHIDGIVIGTTVAALEQQGALKILAAQAQTGFGELRGRLDARAGYLNVAIRLLADQGFVTCSGEPGTDELVLVPTAAGRAVMTDYASAYGVAAGVLPLAGRLDEVIFGGGAPAAVRHLGELAGLMRREWDLPARGGAPRRQVLAHLDGHLVAPVMVALTRRGALPAGRPVPLDGPGLRHALEILARAGWAQIEGDRARLTADGEVAAALARQYRYPMVYLPLLRRVPGLLFGAGRPAPAAEPAGGVETHLNRELDLSFSGDVFAAVCRAPFLEIALPLFDREPLSGQPALVIDTGCGDGAMLAALHEAVRTRTARGRRLDEFPLLMVGADPSPVARRVAAARLAAAGVPHLIMDGDIADPDRLCRALADRGLDARDALHVCKSAIHDRAYRPLVPLVPAADSAPLVPLVPAADSALLVPLVPAADSALLAPLVPPAASVPEDACVSPDPPVSSGAFAQPDGTAIPSRLLALDLVAFFRSWREVTSKHGWIVIEAHTVAATTVAGLLGRTVATALDATHGYSCQYPVEPAVFAWAARAAGFRSRRHAEPAASALGHTILTVDHFVPDPVQTR